VIAASRPVTTGAFIRAKPGTEPGVHKLLANYQTGVGYKFRPTKLRLVRIYPIAISPGRVIMNAPKRNPLKRDEQSSRCRSCQVLNSK